MSLFVEFWKNNYVWRYLESVMAVIKNKISNTLKFSKTNLITVTMYNRFDYDLHYLSLVVLHIKTINL